MKKFEPFINPTCGYCGTPLNIIDEELFDDFEGEESKMIYYECPKCKTMENVYLTAEEFDDEAGECVTEHSYGYDFKCPICGSYVIWGADFMRSEVMGDVEDDDDDSLAVSVSCPHCGAQIEIIEPRPSDLKEINKEG